MLEKTERIMALDVGEKRIGVAVSDPLGITAQGIGVIERQNRTRDLDALRLLIDEHGVTSLLLGLPRNMNGTLGEKAREVQEFGELLAQELGMPVEYQDERLSTRAVEGTLIAADVRRSRRRRVIDKLAAVYILQGYLDRKAGNNK
ncbi:MAG: Holliday junction resolvase RuvX [Syntrophomonadaceae bacterium]|jgi:putative Holliday junction resolvase|nr:Holliday junction resolvase RuvX [Syntrophomonadaceae bacterium]